MELEEGTAFGMTGAVPFFLAFTRSSGVPSSLIDSKTGIGVQGVTPSIPFPLIVCTEIWYLRN